MRTTIRLDDVLLRTAKAQAARAGVSLNDFIADAVRVAVARRAPGKSVELPTFAGRGLQPGVDLDDSAALRDLMDSAPPLRRVAEPSTARESPQRKSSPDGSQ